VLEQPFVSTTFKLNVNAPFVSAFTATDEALVADEIVPFPEIAQEYWKAPLGPEYKFEIDCGQTNAGPETEMTGKEFTVRLAWLVMLPHWPDTMTRTTWLLVVDKLSVFMETDEFVEESALPSKLQL